ncbi:hypothetical protein P4050_30585 [Pseudomonas aeruginosa]|nr:hypothetical protein [Pseudomonas aeruginosa]
MNIPGLIAAKRARYGAIAARRIWIHGSSTARPPRLPVALRR